MPIDLAEVSRIQKFLENAKRKKAEADGAIAQLQKQLKEDFGVSIEEAEQTKRKLEKQVKKLEAECELELEKIQDKFGDKLEDSDVD